MCLVVCVGDSLTGIHFDTTLVEEALITLFIKTKTCHSFIGKKEFDNPSGFQQKGVNNGGK